MSIELVASPDKAIKDTIYNELKSYNMRHLPAEDVVEYACVHKDESGKITGGLTAEIYTNTCFIEYLWVDDSLRGKGVGSQLVKAMEEEAKTRGVTHLYLDTYTFQAEGFYLKLGFEVVGRYRGFPTAGVDKIFLQKAIV
ncbi:GNAT family N-acetyltransferase [Vibrio sonorensis]|uniref:GNAT family N-acetyltransferase n=1 Tax=Vibrio sonorensis TaxID=1004316 RepID=UPI0008DA2F17|nr:GNAT family N-acetyltransferase [Vibrio sonorensis]